MTKQQAGLASGIVTFAFTVAVAFFEHMALNAPHAILRVLAVIGIADCMLSLFHLLRWELLRGGECG